MTYLNDYTNVEFVPLKGFESTYEIMTEYPFNIRNIETHNIHLGIVSSRDGILINLNGKVYRKHRIIAQHFFDDFTPRKCVYHKNGNKKDNHLSNLTYHLSEVDA